jgi:hypothetical protein
MSENDLLLPYLLRNPTNPFRFRSIIRGRLILHSSGHWLSRQQKEGVLWLPPPSEITRDGYERITFAGRRYYTHREVATHFIPIPKDLRGREDLIVHHKDENKRNNRMENLEWMTHSSHSSHHKKGAANHNAKLTAEGAAFIRLARGSLSAKELAQKMGVSEPTIYNIWAGRQWKEEL